MAQNKTKEPVALGGLIIAVFVAAGPMLVAFGVDLSADQLATTQAFVVAAVAVVAYLVRRKVTPVVPALPDLDRRTDV